MKLADFDLNLLLSLKALLDERSVTRAAKRIGISQPAMSGSLAKLRELLDDPLLVRTPTGMVLTARAADLRAPLDEILTLIERTVVSQKPFDPKTAEITFRITTTDYFEYLLMPAVVRALRERAPAATLVVTAVGQDRVPVELEAGSIDLAIGVFRETAAGLYQQLLFDERLVAVVRRDHPRVTGALDAALLADLPHLLVSPRGRGKGPVDRLLSAEGRRRHVAYAGPHFLAAPAVVAATDLVLSVGERLARRFAEAYPLRVVELPFAKTPAHVISLWHERTHRDAGQAWLRALVVEQASGC